MNKSLFATASFLVFFSLCSCGGSGAGNGTQTLPTAGETEVGQAKVKFAGNPKPFVSTSTSGVTVQGLAGAAFSYIDLYPQPSLLNTMILYSEAFQLWSYSYLTGESQELTNYTFSNSSQGQCWGQNGLILIQNPQGSGMEAMYADGSHITPLPAGGVSTNATSSADGSKIAGLDASGNLIIMNSAGTGVVHITTPTPVGLYFTCMWLNASTIVYEDTSRTLYSVPASGGTPKIYFGYVGDTLAGFPDTSLSYISGYDSTLEEISVNSSDNTYRFMSLTPTSGTFQDSQPSVAPDGRTLAFYRQSSAGQNDGYSGIWTESISGQNPRELISDSVGTTARYFADQDPKWSPYPTYRRFVGTGGVVATSASGFLLSEIGPGLSGFFSFVAKTPSTATITPAQSAGDAAPLVFSIHADSITGIWWKNGYYLPSTTVNTSGATDTVVSFNGTNGQITFVAPALATRGVSGKPLFTSLSGQTVCTGHFSGIYDKKGKSLSTGSVTSIHIDSKTGKLLNWS